MKLFTIIIIIIVLCIISFTGCSEKEADDASSDQEPSLIARIELAKCLTKKGWVMYGSYTCSACIAQKKLFAEAFEYIKEIECNPHAPNSNAELCIEKKIRDTPTWILEKDGQELRRVAEYQLLENLATNTGCKF